VYSGGEGDEATKHVLDELGVTNASVTDLKYVHRICEVLSNRSASLVSAGEPRLMLQCCVCLSVCTECIVAKRCVLEQKLLLTAYRKSYMRNRLVPI